MSIIFLARFLSFDSDPSLGGSLFTFARSKRLGSALYFFDDLRYNPRSRKQYA